MSERDIKLRDMYVFVDELPERTLKFGQSTFVPLSPGTHRIKVTNRVFKDSASFTLEEGEVARFEGASIQKPGLLNAVAFVTGQFVYRPVLRRL